MKHNRIKTSGKNALKNAIHHTKNGIHTLKSHTDRLSESTKTRIKKTLAAGALATVVTIGGYQIHEAIFEHDTITDVQKNADRKTQAFTESEYFLNPIHSRAYINASLTRDKMAFIDLANGKTIRIETLPGNWDRLSGTKKQEWRDSIRREISAEYDIPANENNIAANTPRANLESHTDTLLHTTERNLAQPIDKDNPSLSHAKFIEASFAHLTGNKVADRFFQSHILGLVGNESQGDNGKVSRAKAVGMFQLTPHMIKNTTVNPEGYDTKSVTDSTEKQTELAKNLILADYTLVNRYTKRIAEAYFDGDTDKAQEFFIAPLTFNAYNTGIPNIRRTLEPFLEKFPDKGSIDAYLNAEHNAGLGMDAFYAYTLFAPDYAAEYNKNKKDSEKIRYGKDSSEYVLKALAMSAALRHHRENTLSELTPKAYAPNDVSFLSYPGFGLTLARTKNKPQTLTRPE